LEREAIDYRQLGEKSSDLIVAFDDQFRYTYVNPPVERIVGRSREDLLGRTLWAVAPQSEGTIYAESLRRAMRERAVVEFEAYYAPLDRWNRVRCVPEAGGGLVVFARNTTDEHRAQAARDEALRALRTEVENRRKREEYLHRLIESSPDCIKTLELDGTILSISDSGMRLLEIADAASVSGTNWATFFGDHEETRTGFIHALNAAVSGGTGRFQGFCPTTTGKPKWWDVVIVPLLGLDGKPEKLLSASRDITDMRQVAERQRSLEVRERAFLTSIFLQAPAFITVLRGPSHTYELANLPYYRLIGRQADFPAQAILGRTVADVIPEMVEQGFIALLDRVYQTGVAHVGTDTRVVFQSRADAPCDEHFVDFTFQPLTDDDGQVTGIFVHGVDLTERKRAEQEREAALAALRESQERLELAFEAIHLGMWELDLRTGELVWSGEQERLFGLERGDFGGSIGSFLEIVHPDDRERVTENARRRVAHPNTAEYEDEFRVVQPRTGEICWLYSRARIERDPDTGGALRVTGVNIDITERKRAEEELLQYAEALRQSEATLRVSEVTARVSEERYRALVDASSQIVWTNSPDGRMLGEQAGWAAFTGQTYAEYHGFGWADAVHPDDRQPTIEAWNRCVAERTTFRWEHRVRRHDGVYRTFSVRGVPVRNGEAAIREWVGIHTDVTELRANEASLREAADRSEVLNRINVALRSSFDPNEIELAAVTILGEALGADRCYVVAYHVAENYSTASSEYRSRPEDLPAIAGPRYTLSDYDAVMRSFALSPAVQVVEDVRLAEGLDTVTVTRMESLRMRSYVRVPLYEAGILVGSLGVAMADTPRAWTHGETELIQTVAAQVRAVVEAARAHKELEEAEAKQRRIADVLQESMLLVPPPTDSFPGLLVDTHYEAAWDEAQIGGDYGDAFKVDEHRVALLVGDCTGKGLAAARFVSECLFRLPRLPARGPG
jgi:PAS domain S-box-containing protein